jgi:hypothetical protein
MRYRLTYEDKIHEILKFARDAEERGDLDEFAALENSLATAKYYRSSNEPKAHRILDKILRRCGNNDRQ